EALQQAARAGEPAQAPLELTKGYWRRVLDSWLFEEMWKVRNFRQSFHGKRFAIGAIGAGMHIQSGGLWPPGRLPLEPDYAMYERSGAKKGEGTPGPLTPTVDTAAAKSAEIKDGFKEVAPLQPPRPMPEPTIKTGGVVFD